MHGKTSPVWHDGSPPFAGLPSPTEVMRYHSLVVEPSSVPAALRVTARTPDGTIMGLAHRELPIYGVQFHPESILTPARQGDASQASWMWWPRNGAVAPSPAGVAG